MTARSFRWTAGMLLAAAALVPHAVTAQRFARPTPAPYFHTSSVFEPSDPDMAYVRDRGPARGGDMRPFYDEQRPDPPRRPIDRGRPERCSRGTAGTLLGAIAGGLLGDAAIGRHGNHAVGALGGAGAGALIGHAADRDCD